MDHNGVVINASDFHSFKKQWGRDRRSHFVIFVVWKALIVGGWMVVAWGRKSYLRPAENSSFVYLVHFKDGGRRLSLRRHLFISDVHPGNGNFMCKRVGANIFLYRPRYGKVLLRYSASC